jgi:exopolysaccharide biosynthesis polyprenyl glycosylphosphotransferase
MLPWSDRETIERCVDAFLTLPASIHLDPEKILSRFEDLRVSRLGPVLGLNLAREPLTVLEVLLKRVFDLAVSAAALFLLAPFFVMVAFLIKIDSHGPVLFVQRRYGFNQEPFRIFKFRSMTVGASHGEFQQATKDDIRITAIGRLLRRWNIDELPQLLNVFLGEMSLVGPRPHALPHDRAFEERVALYARRHNVKPGITGWAQVNGLRGETSTEELMRQRVEHDLYYIDNWSFGFDLKIILMTLFSSKAYRNAH